MTGKTDIQLMQELVAVQAARAANWPTPHCPANAELELQHGEQLSEIQEQLSARHPVAGTSEPLQGPTIGVIAAPAGNLFSRMIRRILPPKTQTKTHR